MATDHIIEILKRRGLPVTRENYLSLSHPGWDPQRPLHPGSEADLPEELQIHEYDPQDDYDFTLDDAELD